MASSPGGGAGAECRESPPPAGSEGPSSITINIPSDTEPAHGTADCVQCTVLYSTAGPRQARPAGIVVTITKLCVQCLESGGAGAVVSKNTNNHPPLPRPAPPHPARTLPCCYAAELIFIFYTPERMSPAQPSSSAPVLCIPLTTGRYCVTRPGCPEQGPAGRRSGVSPVPTLAPVSGST